MISEVVPVNFKKYIGLDKLQFIVYFKLVYSTYFKKILQNIFSLTKERIFNVFYFGFCVKIPIISLILLIGW